MQSPSWDDLRIFLAAARTKRLDLAARTLGIDPSTVGRRVSRLEATLGATLFEQSRLGRVLTESGRRLLEHVEAMERAALAASGAPADAAGGPTGFVRVSVSESFGTWILARHLREFHAVYPGLTVDLVASGGFLSPSKREADVAVMLARPARGPLVARRLSQYALGLYAARAYLDSRGEPASVAALREHTLVGFVPDLIHVPEQRLLEEIAPDLSPALRSTSVNAQAELVSAGAGIGVLPGFVGRQLRGVRPVLERVVRLERSFWLVVHRDVRRSARVDAFVGWLEGVVRRNREMILGRA